MSGAPAGIVEYHTFEDIIDLLYQVRDPNPNLNSLLELAIN